MLIVEVVADRIAVEPGSPIPVFSCAGPTTYRVFAVRVGRGDPCYERNIDSCDDGEACVCYTDVGSGRLTF